MSTPTHTLVHDLAVAVGSLARCRLAGDRPEMIARWERTLKVLTDALPSGSGWDDGTTVDLDRSTEDKLVLHGSYHHMNEAGMYDGWTNHTILVTPSFIGDFALRISGRDRNGIKDYLADLFTEVLNGPSPVDRTPIP